MPTRSQLVLQTDLAALATLANAKLLPVVNASINPANPLDLTKWHGNWYYATDLGGHPTGVPTATNFYDRHNAISSYPATPALLYPQPNYSFSGLDPASRDSIFDEFNRIRGDALAVVFGNPDGLAWPASTGIFRSQNALVSGPWCVGVNDPATYNLTADKVVWNTAPGVYIFGSDVTEKSLLGELWGVDKGMVLFKNVRFYYSPLEVFNDLSVSSGWRADYRTLTGALDGTGMQTFNLDFNFTRAGQFTATMSWYFSGADPAPDISAFTLTDSSGLVTWEVRTISAGKFLLVAGLAKTVLASDSLNFTLTAQAPAGYLFCVNDPGLPEAGEGQLVARLISGSKTTFTSAAVVHPKGSGQFVSAADAVSASGFTINSQDSFAIWKLSEPDLSGIWVAKTLPVPGLNVYLDQCLSPFVGQYSDKYRVVSVGDPFPGPRDFTTAVSPVWNDGELFGYTENTPDGFPSGVGLPYASSQRQTGQMQFGTHDTYVSGMLVASVPNYNVITSALQPQPTPWPVVRDTDEVRYDLGFNPNELVTKSSNVFAPALMAGSYDESVFLRPAITGLRIFLAAPGTGKKVWKNGGINYGEALTSTLQIYVKKGAPPSTTDYDEMLSGNDFKLSDAFVTAAAGSMVYVSVYNSTGSRVNFDFVVDQSTGPALRQFFPVCKECFSYNINEWPLKMSGIDSAAELFPKPPGNLGAMNKDVPQNGYCIYKIRATRLAVANSAGIYVTPASGDPLAITIGQNILNPDGTITFKPFSVASLGAGNTSGGAGQSNIGAGGVGQDLVILIPADARDSGDVEVFIPVLSGNELVWQCGEAVLFEAWANWQPLFFNQIYGMGHVYTADLGRLWMPKPTALQNGLAFTNWFDITYSNYQPLLNPHNVLQTVRAKVQFPLAIENYNDLIALLNLL